MYFIVYITGKGLDFIFVEPLLPLSLVLGIVGGGLSTLLTLGRKFAQMDDEIQDQVQILDRRIDKVELVLAKDFV